MNMKDENIILFIPMDTSNLDSLPNFNDAMQYDPNTFENEPIISSFAMYQKDSGIDDNHNKFKMDFENPPVSQNYNQIIEPDPFITNLNKKDLLYDPKIDEVQEPFQIKEVVKEALKELDFSNIFIQFSECNKRLEWPISTSIHCKQCCHPFVSRPWYLPCDYVNGVFVVLPYVFCRPEDVLGWNKESNHVDYSKRSSLFYLMLKQIYQVKDITIKISPEQNMLKIFGGPFTIEQFREYDKLENSDYELTYPEIYSVIPTIKHIKQKKNNNDGEDIYKLKRTKPIIRKTKTIFDTIAKIVK